MKLSHNLHYVWFWTFHFSKWHNMQWLRWFCLTFTNEFPLDVTLCTENFVPEEEKITRVSSGMCSWIPESALVVWSLNIDIYTSVCSVFPLADVSGSCFRNCINARGKSYFSSVSVILVLPLISRSRRAVGLLLLKCKYVFSLKEIHRFRILGELQFYVSRNRSKNYAPLSLETD